MKRLLVSLLMFAAVLASPLAADGLLPNIPLAIGEPHPEGNEYWRVNHPALLSHDRDATVIDGIRNVDASLAECVSCHAVKGADAAPVPVTSEQHFCRVCHDYVAVKIDCFQCHNSLPDVADQALLLPYTREDEVAELRAYLMGVSQ